MVLKQLDMCKIKANLYKELAPYTKMNSKWFRDLTVQPKTIKLVEKKEDLRVLGLNIDATRRKEKI